MKSKLFCFVLGELEVDKSLYKYCKNKNIKKIINKNKTK